MWKSVVGRAYIYLLDNWGYASSSSFLVRSKCSIATRVYYIMHTTYNTIVQVHAFTYQAGK